MNQNQIVRFIDEHTQDKVKELRETETRIKEEKEKVIEDLYTAQNHIINILGNLIK